MPAKQMNLGELFPEEFGVEPIPENSPEKKSDDASKKMPSKIYWQYSLDVVNKWAKYQAAKKLYINATHDETRHRVQAVVDSKKYYNGSVNRIFEQEKALSYQLSRLLVEYRDICDFFGVESVKREWLYDHLKDASDYASYRGKCQRRLKNPNKYPAISLKSL